MKKEISAGCCVFRKNGTGYQILLTQAVKGALWGFPKGHLNLDESLEDCALRETMEETGISATILHYCGSADTKNNVKRVFCFNAIFNEGSLANRDNENYDVKWFSIENLPPIVGYQVNLISLSIKKFIKNEE